MKRILLILTVLILSIVLLAAYAWRQSGISVSGISWQKTVERRGLVIQQWSWTNNAGCQQVSGQSALIQWAWPLVLHTDHATVHDCATEPMTTIPALNLPSLPDFSLHINQLQLNQLPPAQIQLLHQQQHWQVNAQMSEL